ncbi:MAG TPA: IS21-like element helper ATPase IstB [Gemmataceae bacterium]|nr:IS21-like element helper ATPase IstB [Gemmataceae bacterium]
MARRQSSRPQPTTHPAPTPAPADLRERILADFTALKVPRTAEQFDAVLASAQREGLSHQQFLHRLIAEQADRRRERRIAHRIREARFRERKPLGAFDREFNRQAIDRTQIEELASGAFVERQDNLVFVGQSGVGKSFLIQAIAEAACVLGYSVRYTTSADLLIDLTASLADQTLPERIRYYARFDLLVIDEFGFEKIERSNSPQAANLLYKIIDARTRQRSTALVTNIDFEAWGDYLGDAPLAMAFLDRVVDGAIILKINGKSYRAHRASSPKPASNSKR